MISVEATGCGFGDGQSVSSPSLSDLEVSRVHTAVETTTWKRLSRGRREFEVFSRGSDEGIGHWIEFHGSRERHGSRQLGTCQKVHGPWIPIISCPTN